MNRMIPADTDLKMVHMRNRSVHYVLRRHTKHLYDTSN